MSDQATTPGALNFTDVFIGMACRDLPDVGQPIDFDGFGYQERDYRPVVG